MPKETNKQSKSSSTTKKKTTKSSTTKTTKPKVPLKINTSKLKVGMTVKNYKELCSLLKQEEKKADSKKAQLKEFECYFDWEKAGQKFIITDIYDKAASKPSYTKAEVGLGNVDNTADSAKSVKYATSAGSASSAGSATKLATTRNFSITGGATAAAVGFNGTGAVTLSVSSLNTDYLNNGSNTLVLSCGGAS